MKELQFWKAHVCFGDESVKQVLSDTQWRKLFPSVYQRLESKDDRIRYDTMIPYVMLKAMAAIEPHVYDFGFRDNILRARLRPEVLPALPPEVMPAGFSILTPLEAFEKFGGECLREAIDYGSVDINKCELF